MSIKKVRKFKIIEMDTENINETTTCELKKYVDFTTGVYSGSLPSQAALKAFNTFCRKSGITSCERTFTIEEITDDKKRKQFTYIGYRVILDPPKEIIRKNTTYTIKYKTTVHKGR